MAAAQAWKQRDTLTRLGRQARNRSILLATGPIERALEARAPTTEVSFRPPEGKNARRNPVCWFRYTLRLDGTTAKEQQILQEF